MKRTQNQRILQQLKRGWLSPAAAFQRTGSMKLATRVGELRKEGHPIIDKWAPDRSYKLYRLAGSGC